MHARLDPESQDAFWEFQEEIHHETHASRDPRSVHSILQAYLTNRAHNRGFY